MKKYVGGPQLVWIPATILLSTLACSMPDTSARNAAIERTLNEVFPALEIPTGTELRLAQDVLAKVKNAESAGLVELRHPSWMAAGLIEVVATPKLIGVALNPGIAWTAKSSNDYLGGEAGDNPDRFRVRVKVREARIEKVLTDEEYKGPLAAPGEKHRLVLGTFRSLPSSAAAVVGPGLASPVESLLRFRCVAKYSDFKKEWSVVAFDVGSLDPELWFTSHVM